MIYFTAHTFNCVCHSIRVMLRVLGMYNFDCILIPRKCPRKTPFQHTVPTASRRALDKYPPKCLFKCRLTWSISLCSLSIFLSSSASMSKSNLLHISGLFFLSSKALIGVIQEYSDDGLLLFSHFLSSKFIRNWKFVGNGWLKTWHSGKW